MRASSYLPPKICIFTSTQYFLQPLFCRDVLWSAGIKDDKFPLEMMISLVMIMRSARLEFFFGNNCLKHLCRRYFGDRCPLLPSYNLSNLTVKKCNLHFLMSNQACFFEKDVSFDKDLVESQTNTHGWIPPIHKLKFPKLFIQSFDNGIFHFKRDPI